MFYKIKITLKNDDVYEIYSNSYLNLCNRINEDLFSGFEVLKLQTVKASMKASNEKTHLGNIIPNVEIIKYKKSSFKNNKEYLELKSKCKCET